MMHAEYSVVTILCDLRKVFEQMLAELSELRRAKASLEKEAAMAHDATNAFRVQLQQARRELNELRREVR